MRVKLATWRSSCGSSRTTAISGAGAATSACEIVFASVTWRRSSWRNRRTLFPYTTLFHLKSVV